MSVRIIRRANYDRSMRVAAYCRVSTTQAEQEESFDTQVSVYRIQIEENERWVFAGIFSDYGRTGTSTKHRPGFLKMMEAAESGEIDIILVKSISRFSRNLVDCQRYVQRLKEINVEVRFEKENISSFDPTADFVFSLLAAIAQDESRSISENVKWTYHENFKRGYYCMGNNRILGYDCDKLTKKLVPNNDAWIISRAFALFVDGKGYQEIADTITAEGGSCLRSGKPLVVSTMQSIISNETYVGDKFLQKKAPVNFLTKKHDASQEYSSYYLQDDHEGIIDRATWDAAQAIIRQSKDEQAAGVHRKGNKHHPLYGKLFCGNCGAAYVRRTFTVTSRNGDRSTYKAWNCRERQKGKGGNGCENVSMKENELIRAVCRDVGWEIFDEAVLRLCVKRILVLGGRVMVEKIV